MVLFSCLNGLQLRELRDLYDPICRFGPGHAAAIRAHSVGGEIFCMQVKCTVLSGFSFWCLHWSYIFPALTQLPFSKHNLTSFAACGRGACILSCLSIAYKENIFCLQHLINKGEADIFFHPCASWHRALAMALCWAEGRWALSGFVLHLQSHAGRQFIPVAKALVFPHPVPWLQRP